MLAPSGFQIPFGQWRITHDGVANAFNHPEIIGSTTPEFVYAAWPSHLPSEYAVNWFVGNMPEFELPLTGGAAVNIALFAGTGVLLLAFGVAVYLKFKPPKTLW